MNQDLSSYFTTLFYHVIYANNELSGFLLRIALKAKPTRSQLHQNEITPVEKSAVASTRQMHSSACFLNVILLGMAFLHQA